MPPPQKPKTAPPLDKFPARSGRGDAFQSGPVPGTNPGSPVLNGETTNSGRTDFTGVAPEVRQSRWHDRSASPRGVLPPDAVVKAFNEALRKALQSKASLDTTRAQLKAEWLPLLRQVVEQAGGDGLDAYVTQLLYPPGRQATTPLVAELARVMERLEAAKALSALEAAGLELRALLARTLAERSPRAISLELQERELDGRVDVDVLLSIRFASAAELAERRAQADKSLEGLRQQLRSIPGTAPESLLSSFSRAKVEKRVLEAEVRRRAGTGLP